MTNYSVRMPKRDIIETDVGFSQQYLQKLLLGSEFSILRSLSQFNVHIHDVLLSNVIAEVCFLFNIHKLQTYLF